MTIDNRADDQDDESGSATPNLDYPAGTLDGARLSVPLNDADEPAGLPAIDMTEAPVDLAELARRESAAHPAATAGPAQARVTGTRTQYGELYDDSVDTRGILLYEGVGVGVFTPEALDASARRIVIAGGGEAHVVVAFDTRINATDDTVRVCIMLNFESAAATIGHMLNSINRAMGPRAVDHLIDRATEYMQ